MASVGALIQGEITIDNVSDATPTQLQDPDFDLPVGPHAALGLQHVLAMFTSNVTQSIVIAAAAGFVFGGTAMVFLIQMAMLFAGVATLFQTIGFSPVGSRLPIMRGTYFVFVPIIISIVKTSGIADLFGALLFGGVILMFGMVLPAGVSMLSSVNWSRHNMMILATSMSVGLGLQQVPKSMQHLPDWLETLALSGLLPIAILAVMLNLILPQDAYQIFGFGLT